MTPPSGWYRDPSAPHLERWWDGTAWTEHRRPPEGAPGRPSAPPSPPSSPAPAPPPPAGGGPTRARAVAVTGAAAVLVAAIVTGVAVLGHDGTSGTGAKTGPTGRSATSAAPSTPPSPSPPTTAPAPAPAADDPSLVVDQLNGITLPLPAGWEKPRYVAEDDVVMTTHGTYDCPAGTGLCRHGLVVTRTASAADGTSAEDLAKSDIGDAADEAYDRDAAGERPFGGITSHRTVRSGPVAVAGRAGYFVRWRVGTARGPGGYVESLAFASSTGTEAPVIVRFVFDAGEGGPPLTDMEKITEGIRPVGDAATSGGVGSSIGTGTGPSG
ncbi:DUF2510 domain-containing protein [Streptomyces sp. NPDC020801]|uniref:DUF2510 domain-containing protein n=1 Tax=Streptomyces sp. NPDC020801 TaxID=3365093 RepID=UPI003799D376